MNLKFTSFFSKPFFLSVISSILLFNTVLYPGHIAQDPDSIFYNSDKILKGKINSVFKKTVVIDINNKNKAIALFTVDSIFCRGLGKVYSREKGYFAEPDSINKFIFLRDHNPDQLWVEKQLEPEEVTLDSSYYQIGELYEFSISAGALTPNQIGDAVDGVTSVSASLGDLKSKQGSQNQFQLGFTYLSEIQWAYGVNIIYEEFNNLYYYQKEKIGSVKSQYVTVTFNASYYWLKLDWIQYYSGFGIGISMEHKTPMGSIGVKSEKSTAPTFNLNFIGVKIGYKLFVELEFGIGYRGLFNLGLAYQI